MGFSELNTAKTIDDITTGVDANNTDSVTVGIDTDNFKRFALHIVGKTGAHVNHIIELQSSANNSHWFAARNEDGTTIRVTGEGHKLHFTSSSRYLRAKVKTAEGEASTVDIYIQGK